MKKWIFAFFSLVFSGSLTAQDCSTFFPFEEKTVMEYAGFDKKGELESLVEHRVAFVEDLEDGGLKARVTSIIKDDQGEEQMKTDYYVSCTDNELTFDMISMLSPQMTQAFSGMELTITGDGLRLPGKLEVGQTLPAAATEIKAGTGNVNLLTMTISVSDRKVEAKESITTESGATYECYRIRYTMESKMLISNKQFEIVEWYAENYGLIRSETYNKKGKLESSTELQSFTRG